MLDAGKYGLDFSDKLPHVFDRHRLQQQANVSINAGLLRAGINYGFARKGFRHSRLPSIKCEGRSLLFFLLSVYLVRAILTGHLEHAVI